MKYSKIQTAARLAVVGACFITAGTNWAAEFWLRAGTNIITMPDGRAVAVWGYAQDGVNWTTPGTVTVPGPQLNVAAGDSLTIHLTNNLPEPVSIVIPGQYSYDSLDATFHSGGAYDGRVRSLTREAAALTGTATYNWTSVANGTCLYHSGSHPSVQVQMGLYGALAVVSAGPQVYAGSNFNSSVTLLCSEIDPDVHDAVAGGGFGPGPSFLSGDFTDAAAAALIAAINGSTDPVAQFVAGQLTSGSTAAGLIADLNTIVGGSSIYAPDLFPDDILSDATLNLLIEAPEVNQPLTGVPYNGNMVRLNRLLLQDGFASAGIAGLPQVNKMTSTIRSYPQYFLVNGAPYSNTTPAITAGAANSTILLRLLNAGMDAHVPTLNNGGDLRLVGEDGQQAPFARDSAVVWMPALKTVDALWTPASAGTYLVYDRRLGLVNGTQSPGGMVARLSVTAPVASPAPVILIQPASQTVNEFATATFRVVASGSGLNYQWQRNAANIAGATTATYTTPATSRTADNGAVFSVVVSGSGGPAVTSANATLTVNYAPPTITSQPASRSVTNPAAASFTVVATGSPTLTYAWSKGASASGPFVALSGPHYSGLTAATLNILSPTVPGDAGFYQVVVTGPGGAATSGPAELRVAPAIVTQPLNTTVADLGTATFTVGATGSSLTYQWQRRTTATGTSFTNVPGATASSFAYQVHYLADNGAAFRVQVSGSGSTASPFVTSITVTNFVTPANSAPVIITPPADLALNSGTAASFSVIAYGYPAPAYQWQRWNGTAWQNLAGTFGNGFTGTNTPTLSASSANVTVAKAGSYRVRLNNGVGGDASHNVYSAAARLTVTQTFTSLGALIPASGNAIPYPSSGAAVPAFTGAQVNHVTVNLISLTHPEPYDLSALLVTPAPNNNATTRKVEFMAGLGVPPAATATEGAVYRYGVNNLNLTFDDAAPGPVSSIYPLPSGAVGAPASGTYQPTVTPPAVAFPAAAGSQPQPPGLPYATTLSAFNGYVQTASAGWRLYLEGTPTDIPITSGGLLVGWSLTLTVGPGGPTNLPNIVQSQGPTPSAGLALGVPATQ
jgi:FtsP/CotA-like multicopper oxidase with cupredoxin domain